MPKQSDLFFAGGAGAISQPKVEAYDASGLVLRDGTGPLPNFTMDEVTGHRIGGFLRVTWKGSFSAAPTGSGNWNIDIGSMGVTLDETRLGSGAYSIKLGNILARDGGATLYGVASYTSSNFVQFLVQHDSPFSGAAWSQSYGSFTSGDTVSGDLYFPVVGWSESELVSTFATQQKAYNGITSPTTITASIAPLVYTNEEYSEGSITYSGGDFTVNEAGYYQIEAFIQHSGSSTVTLYTFVDGSAKQRNQTSNLGYSFIYGTYYLNAGQTFGVRANCTPNATVTASNDTNRITIKKLL